MTSVVSYFRTGSHYLGKSGPYREIFPEVLEATGGHSRVDYGYHLAPMDAKHIEEIPMLIEKHGVASFKIFVFCVAAAFSALIAGSSVGKRAAKRSTTFSTAAWWAIALRGVLGIFHHQ